MAPKLPDSVEGLRAAGNQSFRNGQYAEASMLYGRALRLLQARGTNLPPLLVQHRRPGLALTLLSRGSLPRAGQPTSPCHHAARS